MVVTETTVTTSPSVVVETVYDEQVVQHRRAYAPKRHRAKYRPRPRQHPGERG
jgi:hypothetical protein